MTDSARELPGTREAAEAWESLFRAQVALMRRFQRDDVWGDLSIREYDVLFTLSGCADGTARLRDLGENSLLTQPSLSRMVERLELAGLVRRGPVEGDARGVAVGLTAGGLAGPARDRPTARAHHPAPRRRRAGHRRSWRPCGPSPTSCVRPRRGSPTPDSDA